MVVTSPEGVGSERELVSVPEGFESEVLPLISGSVNADDSGEIDVEELENLGLVLVVMNVSADDDSEVAPLADTVDALSDGVDVVKLLSEVMAVVGSASEEAIEFSEDTTKDPEAEIEEPRDDDITPSVDVRGPPEVV